MPEAPECKITVEYLSKLLVNKKIVDWVFSGGKYTEINPKGFDKFDDALPLAVTKIYNKGKGIIFELVGQDDKKHFIFHNLMASGSWQLDYNKGCKWFVEIDNNKTLWFKDTRGYSTLFFSENTQEINDKKEELGPDILSIEFSLPYMKDAVTKYKNRNITSFLMDQEVIAGCGNYLKSEALYYAGISPLRKVSELSEREIELLYEGIIVTSRISYNYGGMNTKTFSNGCGKNGFFQNKLKIYNQKGAKKTKTPDGRITYWDPKKQV
jgi:DNA-formamidopyrimidine glycosylase